MKALKIIQAIVLPLLFLAGLIGLVIYLAGVLRAPNLRIELGRTGISSLVFLSLALLAAAFAILGGVYLFFNLRGRLPHLLIPVGAALALMVLCGLFFTVGIQPMCSTYTESLSDFETEFDSAAFRTNTRQIYPPVLTGTVTAYRRYEHGSTVAETVTVMYDNKAYQAELARIKLLDLPSFRSGEMLCSTVELDGLTYQIRQSGKTRQITYGRYEPPDDLPDFAPQPAERTD